MNWVSIENICVFYRNLPIFNAQRTKGKPYKDNRKNQKIQSEHYIKDRVGIINLGTREPVSIIKFSHGNQNQSHPTQKPVALFEYLIKTYTNEGETVLDFTMGSGTTGVACKNLNRNFIGIEKDEEYFGISKKRIEGESQWKNIL